MDDRTELLYTIVNGEAVSTEQLERCAVLFSTNYAVWKGKSE